MTTELQNRTGSELDTRDSVTPERNPAIVFLMGKTGATRRTYQTALNQIADVASGQSPDVPKRPRKPTGSKVTTEQLAEYGRAVLAYQSDKETYHNRFLAYDWTKLRVTHVKVILAKLQENGAGKATLNKILAAIKGVSGESFDLDHITGDELKRIERVKGVTPKKLPSGRYVPEGERIALFSRCMADSSAAGVRDAAIFSLGFIAALRRSAIVNLDLANYDPATGKLTLLHTKGDGEREVYITNGGKDALDDWLTIRGKDAGPMFWRISKGGQIAHGLRMTSQAILHIITKRCKQATIAPFTPHDMRRSALTDLIDRCGIAMAQKIAGHANIQTTTRYDMRGDREKLKAAESLTVPYTRRTLKV